jgi:hypothetical protein
VDEPRLTPALPVEPLDELLAEARRYAGYLAKLEARREGTPAHLFTRLHDEYRTRLEALRERAEAEVRVLAEGFASEEAAVRAAEQRLAEAHEAQAEGELRAAVGELEPDLWDERRLTLSAQIAAIGAERDTRAAALSHRRALVAAVERERSGGVVPAAAPASKRSRTPTSQAPAAVSAPAVPPPAPAPAPEVDAPADGKSLRCRGCGTMNFPNEWYCERCGGELAAA